jgi:hypothetical protein
MPARELPSVSVHRRRHAAVRFHRGSVRFAGERWPGLRPTASHLFVWRQRTTLVATKAAMALADA